MKNKTKKHNTYMTVLKPYGWRIAAYVFLLLCSCGCNLVQPYLMGTVIEQLSALGTTATVADIGVTAAIMAGGAAVSLALAMGAVAISSRLCNAFTADLRAAIYDHACDMSIADINRIGVTAMLDRSTYDIMGLVDFLTMSIRTVVMVPVYIIVGCVMAFAIDGALASVMVVGIPLIIVMVFVVTKLVRPLMKRSNMYLDKQNAIVHERLSGIRVIRAFNREKYEHDRMADATNTMADNFVKTNVTMSVISPIAVFIMNMITVVVLYIGGEHIADGAAITAGDLEQLLMYITMIMNALFTAAFSIMMLPRVRVSVTRMNEIFDCPRIARGGTASLKGTVKAQGVAYRYPGSSVDALKACSFEIREGECVALIGGTGSGKSTLLMMIAGLTSPTSGSLEIGGVPYEELTVDGISANVTTVFQKSDFFAASLRENIDPEGRHTDDQVLSALDAAEFGEYARGVGLDRKLTQNANNLSGGQRQRVALARAFLKDAELYIFDDSFSALDYLTEKKVRQNMSARLSGKTRIISTQRVSTAIGCDKILLFDNGSLVATGTHSELMHNDIYKEIYISQTGGYENEEK